MKKLYLYIFLFFSWSNVSFSNIQGKFLYCDVQKHDPEWFKPKTFVFKIDYNKQSNLGKTYLYEMDGVKLPDGTKNLLSGFQLVTENIYHIYPLDVNIETMRRAYDIFINFDEMKAYINLYVKDNELGKRFESICKFVKY